MARAFFVIIIAVLLIGKNELRNYRVALTSRIRECLANHHREDISTAILNRPSAGKGVAVNEKNEYFY